LAVEGQLAGILGFQAKRIKAHGVATAGDRRPFVVDLKKRPGEAPGRREEILRRGEFQAARFSPTWPQIALSAPIRCWMSASECSGEGVIRSRSVPRATVG